MSLELMATNLGIIYGITKKALPEIITPAKVSIACMYPMNGLGEANRLLYANHAMTPEIEAEFAELLDAIDIDEAIDFGAKQAIPIKLQGNWMFGYYKGSAETDTSKKGIAVMRKHAGMTQKQLASEIDTSQQSVNRWENGTVKPGAESLAKIAEALGCSTDDLI